MIEQQLLPCAPAYGHKSHVFVVYRHPAFTAPPIEGAFEIHSNMYGGAILRKLSSCYARWLFSQKSSIEDAWQNSKSCYSGQHLIIVRAEAFYRRSEQKLSTNGVTHGKLWLPLPPNSLDLHQSTRWNLQLILRSTM